MAQQQHQHHSMPAAPPTSTPAPSPAASAAYEKFTQDMHASMETMMADMHKTPPSGNPDIDFLVMMIPHHWGAVEMAKLVLRDGRDPLVREMAEKIMAGQITEIDGMRGRLAALKSGNADYPMLTGNRGP